MKAAAAYSFTIFSRNGSDAAQIIPLYGSFVAWLDHNFASFVLIYFEQLMP